MATKKKKPRANSPDLREVLQDNLRELKVFKVGKVELDIYVVGLDENDVLLGIQTRKPLKPETKIKSVENGKRSRIQNIQLLFP